MRGSKKMFLPFPSVELNQRHSLRLTVTASPFLPEAQRQPDKGGKSRPQHTTVSVSHYRPDPNSCSTTVQRKKPVLLSSFHRLSFSHNAPLCPPVYVVLQYVSSQ